ncbi:MAG TPA: polysulfide reductase NrfD [Nitrospirae bacterium]|nr:polysulfide reductase NrfD [Nitrospirota bacterium]
MGKEQKPDETTSANTTFRSVVSNLLSGTKTYYFFVGILGIMVLAFIVAGLDAVRIGYKDAYGVTREVSWGLLISTYIFFVLISTGLCIVSSIGHVFGVKDLMPITKRAVFLSIVTIVVGFAVVLFEIENPFRMAIYNVISPNLTSNIWWDGTLFGAYLVFMMVEFISILMHKHKIATIAGLLGLISGIVAISNLGAIFAMLHGREYWYGPYLPIYFIASAMLSGCAAIIFFTWIGYKVNNEQMAPPMERAMEVVGKLCTLMITIIVFFTSWKLITGSVGGPAKVEAIKALLTGPFAFNFWFIEMGLGLFIPFILFLMSKWKNLNLIFIASVLMIFSTYFMRYDLVIVGQLVPSFYELHVTDYPGLLSYRPSIHEIIISIGGIALAGFTFLLGEKVFSGHKMEIH